MKEKTTEKTIPRPEHPNPQLMRESWMNLNGEWTFEMDFGRSGRERGLAQAEALSGKILVPFCPESRLSGVGYTDFMPAVWYSRTVELPAEWQTGGRVLLHFGAVEYEAEVWINGVSVGVHRGGYSAFAFDVTKYLRSGENRVTVCAEDDVRSRRQPAGKQSSRAYSYGCSYTRTTGIWQTVWMEHVPDTYVRALRILPDAANERVFVSVLLGGTCAEGLTAECLAYRGTGAAVAEPAALGGRARAPVRPDRPADAQWRSR